MGILDEDVARVRDGTDIVALISEHVALKRVGRRYSGLCPFHQEKTPSFSVSPDKAVWHCFGCCLSCRDMCHKKGGHHAVYIATNPRRKYLRAAMG